MQIAAMTIGNTGAVLTCCIIAMTGQLESFQCISQIRVD